MGNDHRKLPPDRLWQPTTAKWFMVVFGVSLAYAVVRYHLVGDVAWRHFPLFILNKATSLAAVIFGRWHPVGAAIAVLLFAAADAFQIRAQVLGFGAPYQFLVMLPYLVTLIALAVFQRRMRPPSALGINYRTE